MKKPTVEALTISALIWGSAVLIRHFLDHSALIYFAAGVVFFLYGFSVMLPEKAEKAADFCFRYRWGLALTVFLACVALKLSGSSIGMYNLLLPETLTEDSGTLFGQIRAIRSDEWAVQTPTFFSQAYNKYRLCSDRMSLSPTNMVMDYYAPVWDITALGKPLVWGYLLFGNSAGLSWYWCGQLVLLFMLSLELFLILTEDDRKLSAFGSLMIVLAPNIQWWFLPHMPVVLLYAEGLFVIGYRFLTAETDRKRLLLSLASVVAAIGFGLSIFPSYQVPCFYFTAALLAACLFRDRKHITFTAKKWLFAVFSMAAVGLILGRFVMTSRDAIETVLYSVYPGRRISTGGGWALSALFSDLSSLTLPYRDINYLNNCEVSDFIHFAPFFVFLTPRMFLRLKKEGKSIAVGAVLCVAVLFAGFYMTVGIPQWLADLTLLRFCVRMNGIYGWVSAIFTVWGFCVLLRYPDILKKWQKLVYPALFAAGWFLMTEEKVTSYFESIRLLSGIGKLAAAVGIAGLTALVLCALFSRKRLLCAGVAAVMVLCGGTVNPIERGTSAITNHPLYAAIREICAEEPDAIWLNCSENNVMSNYLMACGARVLDGTNFYQDREKWSILDPEGQYEEFTNRYANQSAGLTDGENSVELVAPDNIRFLVTPESLKKLGVRYLLTCQDCSEQLTAHQIDYEYRPVQESWGIYCLKD